MALVINKGGTDKTVICAVREPLVQPFQAPGWIDLRVGWFVSAVKAATPAGDDDPSGISETLGTAPQLTPPTDRYFVGLKTNNDIFPKNPACAFIGYTSASTEPRRPELIGITKLASSDAAIGSTNAFFWRPYNDWNNGTWSVQAIDTTLVRAYSRDGIQPHISQAPGSSGGYASLWMMRLQRSDQNSKTITVSVKQGTHAGDVLFTNTPTKDLMQQNLDSYPTGVQTIGPFTMGSIPNAFFVYWPFHNSRIRIHCMGFMSIAQG